MKIRFLALAALLALAPAIGWSGSVYKWVDENGVVHYGDKQPEGEKSEEMRVRTSTGSGQPSQPSTDDSGEQDGDGQSGNGDSDEQQADSGDSKDPEACKQARENLKVIEENARIRMEVDGEKRYLTEEEIQEQKERMQEIIDQAC